MRARVGVLEGTGRLDGNFTRLDAMTELGNGLTAVRNLADALAVRTAQLSMLRRFGASEDSILVVQGNLANSYNALGRNEEALCMTRDVYLGFLKLEGEETEDTLTTASNYAASLIDLRRFEEAKTLLRKTIPVARRVLGENNDMTLKMPWHYARALYEDTGATLDDLREAVTTLEDAEPTARRVLGGAHPLTTWIEVHLRFARAALRAREAPSASA